VYRLQPVANTTSSDVARLGRRTVQQLDAERSALAVCAAQILYPVLDRHGEAHVLKVHHGVDLPHLADRVLVGLLEGLLGVGVGLGQLVLLFPPRLNAPASQTYLLVRLPLAVRGLEHDTVAAGAHDRHGVLAVARAQRRLVGHRIKR